MSPLTALIARRLLATVVAAGAFSYATDHAGATTPVPCAKPKQQLAHSQGNRLWASGVKLRLCTPGIGTRTIGPWSPGSTVSMQGASVIWAVAATSDAGIRADKVWAYSNGRQWLKGVRPAPGVTGPVDGEVQSVAVGSYFGAWVTGGGQLVLATDKKAFGTRQGRITRTLRTPELLGAGTPAADAPLGAAATPAAEQVQGLAPQAGLLPASASDGGVRQIVGRWPALAGEPLAKSLKLAYNAGDGDGDDCGSFTSFNLTVQPIAGQPRVGRYLSYDLTYNPCFGA